MPDPNFPSGYLDALSRGDLGRAFAMPISDLLTSGGLLCFVAILVFVLAWILGGLAAAGRPSLAPLSMLLGLAGFGCILASGFMGWREAEQTVVAMGAAVTPRDWQEASDKLLWWAVMGGAAFAVTLAGNLAVAALARKDD